MCVLVLFVAHCLSITVLIFACTSTSLSYSVMTQLTFFGAFLFFDDTATTEIYTLSLHDALPILIVVLVLMVVLMN